MTRLNLQEGEWAVVELFGHATLVGRIQEVERFGTKLLAIETLFDGELLPPVYHGGAAIYRLTPCAGSIAYAQQARSPWQLPASIRAIIPPAALEAAPDVTDVRDLDEDQYA
jgi:hypothetical protein